MDFDWKKLVATVAPAIAGTFGTPLLGIGVAALCKALGLPEGSTEEEVANTLRTASPETLAAIKKADQQFAVQMKALDIKYEQIAMQDRDSARKRAAEQKDWTPQIIGGLLLLFWGVVNYQFFSGAFKPSFSPELVGRMLGNIDAVVIGFTAWLYGTTRSSAQKDATIQNLTK